MGSVIKNLTLSLGVAALLIGCGSDDNNGQSALVPADFEVSITNMTNFQPLSPVGVIIDNKGELFEVGSSASAALEKLAEGGDNSELLANGIRSVSTDGPVLPGQTAVLTIRKPFGEFSLSAFSMLVNTNDAFTGVNAQELEGMKVGESITLNTNAYDAGTEANSEAAGTIPGPADGGEGFNAQRDDVDIVRMHSGVVTKDDGLSTSVLTQEAKFDNPVMRVVIKRIK